MNSRLATSRLAVIYFDGNSGQPHAADMWVERGMLQLAGKDLLRQVPLFQVQWPELGRHGGRVAHLEPGGTVQALDPHLWDEWFRTHQLGQSMVTRAQQSWRWTLVAVVLLMTMTILGYSWGLPWMAKAITPLIPRSADQQIGQATLRALDEHLLHPSQIDPKHQARVVAAFSNAAKATGGSKPEGPAFQLHFRASNIGPNALALPDGSIIVTDALVTLLIDRDDVMVGVLAHELGHVQLRHGMRTLVQTGVLSTVASLALGDFSNWLAGAPVLLGQMAYSRDFEREADQSAIDLLKANHVQPSVMIELFERLNQVRQQAGNKPAEEWASAFNSHPADAERIARFKAADADSN